MSLQGKTAVVTGAATSIGQGVALALASAGVNVAVTYHSAPPDDTMRLIAEAGGRAVAIRADVAKADSVKALFAQAADAFGDIHILINDAAMQTNKWLLEYTPDYYNLLMNVNVGGYFLCMREAIGYLKKVGDGRIINVASIHAKRPTNFDPVYSMTKGAIKMLTREAALEFRKYGVTVNALNIGGIEVPTRSGDFPWKEPDDFYGYTFEEPDVPWPVTGYPADVAYLVGFLADERSRYITGSALRADGGMLLL